MAHASFLLWTPLVSAAVWLAIVLYQIYRDRYHTWTEAFFLAACFAFFAYGLFDFLFFNASAFDVARVMAIASLASVMLSALFWMFYGVVLYTRMRRSLFLAVLPTLAFLPLLPTKVLVGLRPLDEVGPPYLPEYDTLWFVLWVALLLTYAIVAVVTYYGTYREVSRHSKKLSRRMRDLLVALIVAVVLGGVTNTALSLLGIHALPMYSTLLVIPGGVALFAVSPLSYEGLIVALRKWKARGYDIVSAILLYEDGTIIGSKVDPAERLIDQDLFAATLDVIQNFMRTSFPGLRGKWLKSIAHGDYELAIERGKYVYLVLVMRGQETDFLRVQMRDELRTFEMRNHEILAAWKGSASDARGTDELLSSFFVGGALTAD